MEILITGVSGFVGSMLGKELAKNGHNVTGIDLATDKPGHFDVDITDADSVLKIFKDNHFDAVYHLAAISRVDFNNPVMLYEININGTQNLLQAASVTSKPKFIFISSSQVYGIMDKKKGPVDEGFPIAPVNHYGASKAAGENMVRAFSFENNMPFNIIRPFNHTGPGQDKHFFVPKLVQAFREKRGEIELGNIDVVRDFLDVRDVVEVYCRLLDNFIDGEIYNISSGKGINISQIIDEITDITGHEIKIEGIDSLIRKNEINWSVGNSSKIRDRFMWEPGYNFRSTLEAMLKG